MFKDNGKPTISRIFKDNKKKEIPMVCFTEEVLAKFKAYVDNCEKEIGWLALAYKDDLGRYIVYDTLLPHQNVSAVTTDLMESGLQEVGEELMIKRPDEFNNVRCWCHSHVNMQVCPSGTDDSTFEQFYANCEYFIRVICNKKSDMRVDFVNIEEEVRYDNINWFILLSNETQNLSEKQDELNKEIDELISKNKKEIEEIEKKIEEYRNSIYKSIEKEVKEEIKEKVKGEKTTYNNKTSQSKPMSYYSNYYNYYDYNDYDDYNNSYINNKKKEEEKEEEQLYWDIMTQEEKLECCEMSSIMFYEKETGDYVEPLDVIDRHKYVQVLEVKTLGELKDILGEENITKTYDDNDWLELFEDIITYGKESIDWELSV